MTAVAQKPNFQHLGSPAMCYIATEGSRGCVSSIQSADTCSPLNDRIIHILRRCLQLDLVLEVDPQVPSITKKIPFRSVIGNTIKYDVSSYQLEKYIVICT